MKLSLNWLKQFVVIPQDISAQQFMKDVTLGICEVDGMQDFSEQWKDIIVGRIKTIKKHPNADKLSVCEVETGKEVLEIVCGGSNLYEGMYVALALVGSKVMWHGEKTWTVLQRTSIRGVESAGMICAAEELELEDYFATGDHVVIELPKKEEMLGKPLSVALGMNDAVYEIENTAITHRPDLWGVYGFARDVSALYNVDLKEYPLPELKFEEGKKLSVKVESSEDCPLYMGLLMQDVEIKESPSWLQEKLRVSGMRPINNIVDATNYVMLELGQPLHAFDASTVKKILVRRAKTGEVLKTLDEKEHALSESNVVITDGKKPIALAGIMGGLETEITSDTKTIFIESANFAPMVTRLSAKASGIRTEASARYEKSLDPALVEVALGKVASLIQELCPNAKAIGGMSQSTKWKYKAKKLSVPLSFFSEKIGIEVPQDRVMTIFTRLGFNPVQTKKSFTFVVPSWRATKDVTQEYDLVEEVSRMHGYDRIAPQLPMMQMDPAKFFVPRQVERRVKQILTGFGFCEVFTYGFTSKEQMKPFEVDLSGYLEIANPISTAISHLRRDLLPGLLSCVEKNQKTFEQMHLFEIGRVFQKEKDSEFVVDFASEAKVPSQDYMITIVVADKGKESFLFLKKVVMELFKTFEIEAQVRPMGKEMPWMIQSASADVVLDDVSLGMISTVSPALLQRLGITVPVVAATIPLSVLVKYKKEEKKYIPVPKYPPVVLDMAIVIPESVYWLNVLSMVHEAGKQQVALVELFDVYVGPQVGEGKKSFAFHIHYRSDERTLTLQEAQEAHQRILKALEEGMAAKLRT